MEDKIMTPVKHTQTWLPEMFNDLFNNNWMLNSHTTAPAVNVLENENSYMVEVAAPGMEKKDFKISLEDEQLVISMEKKENEKKDSSHDLRREFNYASFKQAYVLPEDVVVDKVSAKMENGVLTIVLPKKEEAVERQKNRDISIE